MLSFLVQNHEIGHYSGYQTRVVADYSYELTSEADLSRLAEIYQWVISQDIPLLVI